MQASLIVENLSCARGERTVFEGLSFSLAGGCALLLHGPNGSGKSTLLKCLAGLLDRTQGSVQRGNVAYLGHKNALKSDFTVGENLKFWTGKTDLKGFLPDHLMDIPVRYLSAGQARRVALARLVSEGAPLWLLDEPTVGLDGESLRHLKEILEKHLQNGGMMIVATHVDMGLQGDVLDLGKRA